VHLTDENARDTYDKVRMSVNICHIVSKNKVADILLAYIWFKIEEICWSH
jgi:hypothetical protein